MNTAGDRYVEALTREYEQNRARVWEDEGIRPEHKQAEVNRLWQEFDERRREARDGGHQGHAVSAGSSGRGQGRAIPFLRPRRRPWK